MGMLSAGQAAELTKDSMTRARARAHAAGQAPASRSFGPKSTVGGWVSQMGPARRAQECQCRRRSAVEHRRSDSESRGWLESCGGVVETGGGCER